MFPPKLFLETVVRPALRHLAVAEPRLNSLAAEQLLVGTALTESRLDAVAQTGGGPARSYFQIEPATFNDLWQRYGNHPAIGQRLATLAYLPATLPLVDQLYGNTLFAAAIARIKYWSVPAPLPSAGDWPDLAAFWKRYYNTQLGAGTPAHFLAAVKPAMTLWVAD